MAIKSAWAYRNGNSQLRSDVAAAEAERQQRNESMKRTPEQIRAAREAADRKALAYWDGLSVGDNLRSIGMGNIVIAKKNAKSIVSTLGTRWTRKELIGL